ncbi:MAG: hypothetical protein IT221_09615 [Fluviicola sp.]|nr:hypothetical protein [Fluviicola sp.]
MKFNQERTILQLEEAITAIEINARAENSENDIEQGNTRLYADFSNEVKQWIQNKTSK